MTTRVLMPPTRDITISRPPATRVPGMRSSPPSSAFDFARAMLMRSRRKSTVMRSSVSPATPRMPSAPAMMPEVTMGAFTPFTMRSPASSRSMTTEGTSSDPVTPFSSNTPWSLGSRPRRSTSSGDSVVWLAPVSTTSRNGPCPLIITGATIRPMRSRRVGEANRASSGRGLVSVGSGRAGKPAVGSAAYAGWPKQEIARRNAAGSRIFRTRPPGLDQLLLLASGNGVVMTELHRVRTLSRR